jgi:hypothetical protein
METATFGLSMSGVLRIEAARRLRAGGYLVGKRRRTVAPRSADSIMAVIGGSPFR